MIAADRGEARVLELPRLPDDRLPGAGFTRRAVGIILATIGALATIGGAVSVLVSIDVTVRAAGVLEPLEIRSARAEAAGIVREVMVHTGDTVRAGQLLVHLDALDLERSLAELQARYRALDTERKRAVAAAPFEQQQQQERIAGAQARLLTARAAVQRTMADFGLGANADSLLAVFRPGKHVVLDAAVGDFRAAEAEARLAGTGQRLLDLTRYDHEKAAEEQEALAATIAGVRERIARTEVRAHSAGVVLTERIDQLPGTFVQPGALLLDLADLEAWRVTMRVAERDIHKIRSGDAVKIQVQAFDRTRSHQLRGRVTHVGVDPAGDAPAGAYRVAVEIARGELDRIGIAQLRRGYTVDAHIITRSEPIASLLWSYALGKANDLRLTGP